MYVRMNSICQLLDGRPTQLQKLAAGAFGGGAWTSTDSGLTWTHRTGAGTGSYWKLAMSADGTVRCAVAGHAPQRDGRVKE